MVLTVMSSLALSAAKHSTNSIGFKAALICQPKIPGELLEKIEKKTTYPL